MANVKHGIQTWLRTGRINPSIRGHRKLQKYLREMERELIELYGGPESITVAQEILIKATIEAFGILMLATMYCKKHSILRPDKERQGIIELQPVLGNQFIAFLNTLRQNLISLGLERKKADEALDLGRYVAEKYGKKEGEKKDD